jgi:hypothetical protein
MKELVGASQRMLRTWSQCGERAGESGASLHWTIIRSMKLSLRRWTDSETRAQNPLVSAACRDTASCVVRWNEAEFAATSVPDPIVLGG